MRPEPEEKILSANLPAQQFVSEENKQILKDAGYKVVEKESMLGKEILINWENA